MHTPVSKKTKPSGDPLFVLCPITKNSIVTKIKTDVRSLTKVWHSKIQVPCPHCKEIHKYSERSVCGGGDLGRTYQRRLSCKLALIINDSRVEPAELKRVTQPALVFAVAVHLLRPMC